MLPEFKKRIDTLRDILVGAVPSPAGQIEQITYALIYKFMSDIDDRAASLPGGKRTYFTGEYEKYGWHELMAPTLGAHDRLTLYREALGNLNKNPGFPELFQSIYQNAYLTFNDPRVLTLFLKELDNFKHSGSDDIGDAYEYLLQITGAQGDVGQFRTPRHIIKFIVEAVNPTKSDKVLDPAVGTAGFLIAAYNHVKHHHDGVDEVSGLSDENETRLTADEKGKMNKNYHGFDIDPTMVRTSKVNMYLHGFTTPDIKNHDSLSSEDFWAERYDVILANPPFMSPKGGIKPHDKFGIVANRAEVLFVDYIASHLKPTGRAGIVVPEGIIFQSGKAYRELRKNLVDNYLYAVVSLPAGVFQPYSGVKTSVLLLDKKIAKEREEILFVKVENDGYSLGAQRRETAGSQFPEALEAIQDFQTGQQITTEFSHSVSRKQIAKSGDFNLNGERYKATILLASDYQTVRVGDVALIDNGNAFKSSEYVDQGARVIRITNVQRGKIVDNSPKYMDVNRIHEFSKYELHTDDLLMSLTGNVGRVGMVDKKLLPALLNQRVARFRPDESKVLKQYLFHILNTDIFEKASLDHSSGIAQKNLSTEWLKTYEIPLPPIETQREIVAELNGYQQIIDAAHAILKTYKPTVNINPGWSLKKLSDITERVTKGTTPTTVGFKYHDKGVNFIKVESITPSGDFIENKFAHIDDACHEAFRRSKLKAGDVLFSIAGALGRVAVVDESILPANTNQALSIITPKDGLDSTYLSHVLRSSHIADLLEGLKTGVAQSNLSLTQVSNFIIPVPSIDEQQRIVAELGAELQLIYANKKLIETFQLKIKNRIAKVWGE